METKFQTSFIPKQPVTAEAPRHSSMSSLFFLFSFIIFMASLAAAGGVFIYDQVVRKNIDKGKSQLTINRNAFDPNTISQITRLNDRINAADFLLKRHKSVSTLFLVLGNATLKNVRFNDFNYLGADDKISLTMRGQATSYETVALQAKEFTNPSLKNVFRSPIFSDLTLDTQGNVSFSFSTNIDPFLVDYYKLKKEEYAAGISATDAAGVNGGASGINGSGANSGTRTNGTGNGDNTPLINTGNSVQGASEAGDSASLIQDTEAKNEALIDTSTNSKTR